LIHCESCDRHRARDQAGNTGAYRLGSEVIGDKAADCG
jgi:hypothetical protein